MDRWLAGVRGEELEELPVINRATITQALEHDMPWGYEAIHRQEIPMAPPELRRDFTSLVEVGFDTRSAVAEGSRCLQCNHNINIDGPRCILCGLCADVCPEGVIYMVDKAQVGGDDPEVELFQSWPRGIAMIIDEERCIRCNLCVERCPTNCITMDRLELERFTPDGKVLLESYKDNVLGQIGQQAGRGGAAVTMNDRGNPIVRYVKKSQAWRALFRQPYPTTSRTRALAVMNNVFLHLHPVRVKKHAVRYTYTFCLGGISFFMFLALTVTGLYLMFFYVPSVSRAYQDIQAIENSVAFGQLVRNMHRWAAHLMVLTVFLHMVRVFYHGAYKPPREFNWVVGVVLLFLTLGLSFTGYLLPWDQIAFWAITVGTQMANYAPVIGSETGFFLLGGIEVGSNTLLRFYVFHVIFLPLVAAIFMIVHFWRIRKDGGISGPV